MARLGISSWDFRSRPVYVQGIGTVTGQLEGKGPLGSDFDEVLENDRIDGDTWEHSEQRMFAKAVQTALAHAHMTSDEIDYLIGADLNAQLTGFYHGTRAFARPTLGVFSACASICESLAVGALLVHTEHARFVVAGTSSHTSTAERQFRYPTEYGAQKPPTAQRTVTGAGASVLGANAKPIELTHATIGTVLDYGIPSPWEMGAAMAPAACHTILQHFRDTDRTIDDYDLVVSGDLGQIGLVLLKRLLSERGYPDAELDKKIADCGAMVYHPTQPEVFSGGSGAACCSIVTFGHLLKRLMDGTYRRILVSATGALLSSVSAQQKDTIPSVSHAIAFERKDEIG